MISKKLNIKTIVAKYHAVKLEKIKPINLAYYCDCCKNYAIIKSEIKGAYPVLIQCDKHPCKGFMKAGAPIPFLKPTKEFYFPSLEEAIRLRGKHRTILHILSGGLLIKDIV
jgi:hypothetical protein